MSGRIHKLPTTKPSQNPSNPPKPTTPPAVDPMPVGRTGQSSEAITKDTPFRSIGTLSAERVCDILYGSPMASECQSIATIKGNALALAQSLKESQYGKTAGRTNAGLPTNNPLGLMERDGHTLVAFRTWADAFREWQRRMDDPTYKGGVYMPEDMPLERFVRTYVAGPGPGYANGETPESVALYLRQTIDRLNGYFGADEPKPTPRPKPKRDVDPWRPYPFPPMVDVHVVKPGEGAGFDRVAPRGPRIVGSCNHITDGEASIEWYRDFFSTGGERAWDALTDTVIGRDGRIGLLNDWRAREDGTRAGWANGTATGIEGDGTAFYRRYPLINDVLVSKEHVGRAGQAMADVQMAASIELSTAVAQSVKCPWDSYPYHPGLGGVNIEQQHRNFAPKSCPAEPFISTHYPVLVREVKAKLKAWQGGIEGDPMPTPQPVWYTRFGFSLDEITTFFGVMVRYNEDGTTDDLPFDPKGSLSLLWLNRCDREGKFPESERIWTADAQFVEGKEIYASWEGGWIAFLPLADSRASWQWLDLAEVPA